jgi:sugar fermentation stimulation protein A
MKFKAPLTEAILLRRYFRFLADVALKNKKRRTLYCPNLGPLTHCDILGSRVWFSNTSRLSHGYLDVWELVEVDKGWLVCVHPEHAKHVVMEGIHQGLVPELKDFRFLHSPITPAPSNGVELLLKENGEQCFLYIEPVLFGDERGDGYFPEKVGMGTGALKELIALKEANHRAMIFYCVQHMGIRCLRPADAIDPTYGKILREAHAKGVEILAYRTDITLREMNLGTRIPVLLSENIAYR